MSTTVHSPVNIEPPMPLFCLASPWFSSCLPPPCRARTCPYCRRSRYALTSPLSRLHKHDHCPDLAHIHSPISLHLSVNIQLGISCPSLQGEAEKWFLICSGKICWACMVVLVTVFLVMIKGCLLYQPIEAVWDTLFWVISLSCCWRKSTFHVQMSPTASQKLKIAVFYSHVSFSNKAFMSEINRAISSHPGF